MRDHGAMLIAACGIAVTAVVIAAGAVPGAAGDVHLLPVQGNVSMLVTSAGNVTVQIGDQGVLVVDTSVAEASDGIVAAIRRLTDKPIRYIINTHAHADHTGGNANIARAGATVGGGTIGAAFTPSGASILAHENVLTRMSAPTGSASPTPTDACQPTRTSANGKNCSSTAKRSRSCISRRLTPTATAWC